MVGQAQLLRVLLVLSERDSLSKGDSTLGPLCTVDITLKFLLILPLNLCFVSDICWDNGECAGAENLTSHLTVSLDKTSATSAPHPTVPETAAVPSGALDKGLGGNRGSGMQTPHWAPVRGRGRTRLSPEGG